VSGLEAFDQRGPVRIVEQVRVDALGEPTPPCGRAVRVSEAGSDALVQRALVTRFVSQLSRGAGGTGVCVRDADRGAPDGEVCDENAAEPGRLARLTLEAAGPTLDLSKQPWSRAGIDAAVSYGAASPLGAAFCKTKRHAPEHEWLFAWRPMQEAMVRNPVVIRIGSIEDIAELRVRSGVQAVGRA